MNNKNKLKFYLENNYSQSNEKMNIMFENEHVYFVSIINIIIIFIYINLWIMVCQYIIFDSYQSSY